MINGEAVLNGLKHIQIEEKTCDLILDFADTQVSIESMQITKTYRSFLEGVLNTINACIIERELEKFANAAVAAKSVACGYHFVMPILYDIPTPHLKCGPQSSFGKWRFEIKIEKWVKSTPEKEFSDQMYTLTLVLFSNKISDDQNLSQHLSQYTKDLKFFDLAHKCTDEEMSW